MREIEVVADDVEILPLNDELCSTSLRNCVVICGGVDSLSSCSCLVLLVSCVLPKVKDLHLSSDADLTRTL